MPSPALLAGEQHIDFGTFAGLLVANGKPFSFKVRAQPCLQRTLSPPLLVSCLSWFSGACNTQGITWPGMETVGRVPLGLALRPMDFYLDFLREERFNAIRLPIAHQSVLDDAPVSFGQFDPRLNPDLMDPEADPNSAQRDGGLPYQDALLAIARRAAEKHLLVVVSAHRLKANHPNYGMWYNNTLGISEESAGRSWDMLTAKLCSQWNVVGVDLYQEPYRASWGSHNIRTDWNLAAERLGNRVLAGCPRWLVFVQGITTGAPEDHGQSGGYFDGENLVGVKQSPVRLSQPDRLVYAPHTRGPSSGANYPYFKAATFPNNLPAVWTSHFLDAREVEGTPMVIGELGGNLQGEDRLWQEKALSYLSSERVGIFYHSLMDPSGKGNGLMADDFASPVVDKVALLRALPTTDVHSFSHPSPPPQIPSPPSPPLPSPPPPTPHPPPPPPPPGSPPSPPPPPPPPAPIFELFARDLTSELLLEVSHAPLLSLVAVFLLSLGCHYLCCRARATREGTHRDRRRQGGRMAPHHRLGMRPVHGGYGYDDYDEEGSDVSEVRIEELDTGGRLILYK